MPAPLRPPHDVPPRPRPLATILLAILGATCAPAASQVDPNLPAPVRLHVENHGPQQMRVFVHHDGQLTRIGEVPAATTQAFVLPARLIGMTGEVRLAAEPIAAFARYVSETLIVRPGQLLILTLERKLDTSSAAVR